MAQISILPADLMLWTNILLSSAALIAGNFLACTVSFYIRHTLREKMKTLEILIQFVLMVVMTIVYPIQVSDFVARISSINTTMQNLMK